MLKRINVIIILFFILLTFTIANCKHYDREDVNRDGKVDALDLLIVQKKILNDYEEREKNKN